MKKCKVWKSDDGKMYSFIKQEVVKYEYDQELIYTIDREIDFHGIDDCDDLVLLLTNNEAIIRKIMGWEQITF